MPSPAPPEGTLGAAVRHYTAPLRDPTLPLEVRVRLGAEAWDAIAELNSALDQLKKALRDEAHLLTGEGRSALAFEGEGTARATVTMAPATYRLLGTVNPVEAAARLGLERFHTVFHVGLRNGLTPDALDPAVQAYLRGVAVRAPQTARVSFERVPGVVPVG